MLFVLCYPQVLQTDNNVQKQQNVDYMFRWLKGI